MNRAGIDSDCQRAKLYYYDYLSDQRNQVPVDTLVHISNCSYCQKELEELAKIDENSGHSAPFTSAQTAHLELHFALANQPIDCSTIRAFLPVMAIPEQQVSILTPVTAHLAHCRQCTEQFRILEDLDLSVLQYGQVSQLFSSRSTDRLDSLSESEMKIISDILMSPDSGVVTRFCFKDNTDGLENRQLFDVEVLNYANQAVEMESFVSQAPMDASVHPRLRARRRSRFLRPIAAAAVLMLGVFLFFQNTSVQATDISQIYETLKDITNIKIVRFGEDLSTPVQEVWISRSLGLKVVKTDDTHTLFDVKNRIRRSLSASNAVIQATEISSEMTAAIEKTMNMPWGLLPFNHENELPEGAVWEKVYDPSTRIADEATEMFDLFWTDQAIGRADIAYQWRCILDRTTKRPLKTQLWRKLSDDTAYILITTIEISYPSEAQIQTVAKQSGLL